MNWLNRLKAWSMRLPASWGLSQTNIHSSLLITLGLLSVMLLILSYSRPSLAELRPAAITLPLVWILSLAVRIATQQLALGNYANETQTLLGPTGNLSTDYEYLPRGRLFAYALSGQLATLCLVLLGILVNVGMETTTLAQKLDVMRLIDFKSGWDSDAWATQIMWVNLFIASLNTLPTVPFDMRAGLWAVLSRGDENTEATIFNRLALFDSHLAATILGVSIAAIGFDIGFNITIVSWYIPLAMVIYLFVASRWEASRAADIEGQYSLFRRRDQAEAAATEILENAPTAEIVSVDDPDDELLTFPVGSEQLEFQPAEEAIDLDEILRKLHQEGKDSLSAAEHAALLSASRALQEKKRPSS